MKKTTVLAIGLAMILLGFTPLVSKGQLLVEDFDYSAGTLLTQNGWTAHSGSGTQAITVNNGGLSFNGYASSAVGNAALVDNNGEDVNKVFTLQTTGSVYAAFMVNVTTTAAGYFFNLGGNPINTTFRGKVFIDGTNHFGISVGSNTGTYAATTFTNGTTYLLVVKYQINSGTNNDAVSLYVFDSSVPLSEPATPTIGPLTDNSQSDIGVGSVALRQYLATQNFIIDGIRVTTVWSDLVASVSSTPTQLAITSVNGGSSPLVNTPFNVTVQAQDASNSPANVTANTDFTLSLATGTGTLGGTLTGTIPAGSNTAIVTGVTYNTVESGVSITATRTSGDILTAGTSAGFTVLPVEYEYRSAASGNWNDVSTWEAYTGSDWIPAYDVPASTTRDVTIRTGHSVVVPAGYNSGTMNNLTVETGATLYANAGSGSCFLYVYGNILNNGTIGGATDVLGFDIEGSNCHLSGTGSFIVSRIAKYTTVNTTTTFTINQDVTLTYTSTSSAALRNGLYGSTLFNIILGEGKKLSVPNAKIDLAGCTFTMKNNATLLDNGTISGSTASNTVVERFLTKYNDVNDGMFHLLSSPVSGQAISPAFSDPANNNTDDFFKFDETTYTWINYRDDAGTGVNSGFGENTLLTGRGYLVSYANDATRSFTGALNTGTLVSGTGLPALTYTSSLNASQSGWNLMGNPYPSAIDWDNVTASQYTNLDNAIYVYDNASASYKEYVGGVGTLTDGIIPVSQGFFIHANADAPSLTLENDDRVHSAAAVYKNSPAENVVRLKVEGNNRYDETIVRFTDEATTGFDGAWDAYKLYGASSVPTFYSTAGNQKLSVNALPSTSLESFVPLAVEAGAPATYTLELAENSLPESINITLEDLNTGTLQQLNTSASYQFTAAPGEDPDRFRLHFKDAASVAEPAPGIKATIYAIEGNIHVINGSNVNADVSVTDLAGRCLANSTVSSNGSVDLNMQEHTGVFIVRLASDEGSVARKVFVK